MAQTTAYVHKDGDANLNNIVCQDISADDISCDDLSAAGPVDVSGLAVGTLASGPGITLGHNGRVQRATFKMTVAFGAFSAAALTKDIKLGILPAKARLVSVIADTTEAFAGPSGTIQLGVGKTAGGVEFLVAHDVKSAPVTKGLADADLGTSINRANAIQGGHIHSWSAGCDLYARITSGADNLDTLSAGSVTFYFVYELQ